MKLTRNHYRSLLPGFAHVRVQRDKGYSSAMWAFVARSRKAAARWHMSNND